MIYLTPENEAALREDVRRVQALPGKKKCDDAYREAQHVDLDTYRRIFREEAEKKAAKKPAPETLVESAATATILPPGASTGTTQAEAKKADSEESDAE